MSTKTVKITKAKALKAFGETTDTKELMLKLFGKGIFPSEKKPSERNKFGIKTFNDACKVTRHHPVKSMPYPKADTDWKKSINAYAKLRVIAEALNEGWEPDWNNSDETKYIPWFNMQTNSGVGFSFGDYGSGSTNTDVGSRLCFKSRELAEYAGKQFQAIYKDFLTL